MSLHSLEMPRATWVSSGPNLFFLKLAKAARMAYFYMEENKVYYFEKTCESDEEAVYARDQEYSICTDAHGRFCSTGLQIFQVGDIMEVQVLFIAIPIHNNKWKINSILRSISLFNRSFTQVCILPITLYSEINYKTVNQDAFVRGVMHRTTHEDRPKPSLKQKVGYIEEQVSATWVRMVKMHIDAQNDGSGKESELDLK